MRILHTVGGTALALAIITVIVTHDEWLVDVNRVGDCLTEAVASKRHDGDVWARKVFGAVVQGP